MNYLRLFSLLISIFGIAAAEPSTGDPTFGVMEGFPGAAPFRAEDVSPFLLAHEWGAVCASDSPSEKQNRQRRAKKN